MFCRLRSEYVMLEKKLAALEGIYVIYDNFMKTQDIACKKYCAHCCTANVTLTTLEGYYIISKLVTKENTTAITGIREAPETKRFQPQITTNQLAALCAEGIDPPPKNDTKDLQPCPVLSNAECPIYLLRPFGCRCLVSRQNCAESRSAEVDDFVLSVNTVFLQIIEHVDHQGCTGNLLDLLKLMTTDGIRGAYEENALKCAAFGLIKNQPLSVLMIPPEHRMRMEPILAKLRELR